MTPKPFLSLASHCRIGYGFQISNKRNSKNAVSHHGHSTGLKVSTSNMATISSQTIPPWSTTPRALPVMVQMGMPIRNRPAMTAHWIGRGNARLIQASGNAAKVPNVPGAILAKPLPKPSPRKWAGCCNKNCRLGVLAEVVKTSFLEFYNFMMHAMDDNARPCWNLTN